MSKKIALAASVVLALVGPSRAEVTPEGWATATVMTELFNAQCPGKVGTAWASIVGQHSGEFSATQKRAAVLKQSTAFISVGKSAYCDLVEGQMALVDKKMAESLGR